MGECIYMESDVEYQVKDQRRIQWLLSSLKTQNQLVTLCLSGTNSRDRTMIVDVCAETSTVLLDAAVDSDIHKKIQHGHEFTLTTVHDGVDVRAESVQAVDTVSDSKGMLYKIPFPAKLFYIQRRDNFRISLSGLFDIPVKFEPALERGDCVLASAECSLENVSANGCLVSVSDSTGGMAVDSQKSVVVKFDMPDAEQQFEASSSLKHSRYLKRSSKWLIGFEFHDMPHDLTRVLERFVVKLQMEARQRSRLD